jgi:hypothetical protein
MIAVLPEKSTEKNKKPAGLEEASGLKSALV